MKVTITLKKEDVDPGKSQYSEYSFAGGLVEYVKWLNADKVHVYLLTIFLQFSSAALICDQFWSVV